MELGWPLPKRKQFLKDLIDQKSEKTHPVPFQGRMQYLSVYSVPIGLPLYRLENGRTTASQAEYLANHKDVPVDFFRADYELDMAQKAQHAILAGLARGAKNLFAEFEEHEQSEPLILSSVGYVINGNRRLSTWRSLYFDDSRKYKHFANIEVIILPHTDDKDLDRLEADLQLKEDLKAEYSWTSTGLMLREKLVRFKYTDDEIAAIYDMTNKEVRELFDCLDYGQQYLETRNTPNKYSDLDDKEFAFRQICRTRAKMRASEAEKELFERAAFCLTDEAEAGTRIYAEIPKIADLLNEIRDNLVSELDIVIDKKGPDEVSLSLVDALEDIENFEKARLAIRDTIESESSKKKNKKKQDVVLTQVERAHMCLTDAVNLIEPSSGTTGVVEVLDRIDQQVQTLRAWAVGNGK